MPAELQHGLTAGVHSKTICDARRPDMPFDDLSCGVVSCMEQDRQGTATMFSDSTPMQAQGTPAAGSRLAE